MANSHVWINWLTMFHVLRLRWVSSVRSSPRLSHHGRRWHLWTQALRHATTSGDRPWETPAGWVGIQKEMEVENHPDVSQRKWVGGVTIYMIHLHSPTQTTQGRPYLRHHGSSGYDVERRKHLVKSLVVSVMLAIGFAGCPNAMRSGNH